MCTFAGNNKKLMPQESRLKKSLLNARVNLIFYFLSLALSFFSRKIFLDALGADFMGLIGTLNNLLGFLNLAELGISTAIGYVLYKPLFEHDEKKINEIISVFGFIYRRIGFIILSAGCALACFLPLIFPNNVFDLGVIYFAFFSYLTTSLIGYFANYKQTLLGADQKNYVVTAYFQSAVLIKTCLQMGLVYYTGNYYLWISLELLLGIAAAWLVAKLLRMRIGTGLRTFTLTAGVQNYAFFVIPIIQMLFTAGNDPTLGILFVHNVGCELVVWSIGVIIIAGGPGNLNMGVFFRGPLLAVIVGLALAWSGLGTYVAQPPLMKTFEMIGNCATPLCLILFGCSMRDLWHNMKWEPKPIICGLLTRLGLAPALLLLMAYFLPVDDYLKRVIIIQAAIPSAVIPVILAKRFGGHPDLGTQILLTTTVASFLTLPCWLALGSTLVVPLY